MKTPLVTLSALTLCVAAAQAELLVYEGFDYADNTTLLGTSTLGGGIGLTGTWVSTDTENDKVDPNTGNAHFEVDDNAVTTWGALTQTGSALKRQDSAGIEVISRSIDTSTVDLDAGEDLWFSVLVGARGTAQFAIASGTFADGSGGNGALSGSNGFGMSMSSNATGNVAATTWDGSKGTTASSGNPYGDNMQLFVGHITWGLGGANDTYNLYAVNDTDLTLGTVVASRSADIDESLLDTITYSTNRGQTLDEIRIGTTFEDVVPVPEPSTYAMLAGLLALSSVMIRRRK